ncbi:hypothetical protein N0V85_004733 [Neurospora sp. IMI 360204]|nr:hypothetical protein N0V85_004733 [Neurospora sp. IMI 360204]
MSLQEAPELAFHRLIRMDNSVPAPSHQKPPAQEAPSKKKRSALYDPVRDTVLPAPESSPVAAEPVQGHTLSEEGNIETTMGTTPSPTLSEPGFRNIAGNNTQLAEPNAQVEIDRNTALTIRLSDLRRPSASAFCRTSVTAVKPNQYQNHGQKKIPLPQTPPSQRATQAPPPDAPKTSPIPQRATRMNVPAMYNDMIAQETLLCQSNPELHEQVREAASYGFITALQPGNKRSSDAALSPPSEGQEPPIKKLHNRGGARPGAGRPSKMLRQQASGTALQPLRAGSLWDRPTSATGPRGGDSAHAASVAGAGSFSGFYSAFTSAPSAGPHNQPPDFPPASAAPSGLSGTSPSKGKKRKADEAGVLSLDENLPAPVSSSVAVSVAASVLELWKGEPPRLPLAALDIEKGGDAGGGKGDNASADDKKEEERKEEVVEDKSAGEEVKKEASKSKESECTTQAKEEKETQPVSKGTQKGNRQGIAKRKAEAITPMAEPAAEEPAKDEPPAKRAKTAAMSSSAAPEASVRRSTGDRKPTAKVRDNMLQ